MLPYDLAVHEVVNSQMQLLMLSEIDGIHHFDPNHSYGSGEEHRERRTFQNDLLKEEFVFPLGVPLTRLEQRTAEKPHPGWMAWYQGKVVAAINRELPVGVTRFSTGSQYVSGQYAAMRRDNPRLDPTRPMRDAFVVKPEEILPIPSVKQESNQPTIQESFAAAGGPSSVCD